MRVLTAALIALVLPGCGKDDRPETRVDPQLNPTFYGSWKSECVAESHNSRQSVIVLGLGGLAKVWERVYANTQCLAPEEFTTQTRMKFTVLSTTASESVLELIDFEIWPPFPSKVTVLRLITLMRIQSNDSAAVRLLGAEIKDETGIRRALTESEVKNIPEMALTRSN